MALLRRYGGTAGAYGISSVCTFALTLLVARLLPESEVAVVSLVLATGALAAALGTGIDAAAARTAVRAGGTGDGALFLRASRLRLVCFGISLVPLVAYLLHAGGSLGAGQSTRWLAIGCFVVYAAGACAAYVLCYEPQASGNIRLQAAIQAIFSVPVLVAALVASLVDPGAGSLVAASALGSLPVLACFGWKLVRSRKRAPRAEIGRSGDFRGLALALTAGTIGFGIFQRLDLLWVGATRSSNDVAQYAIANRVVSGFSLLTATLVVVGLPTIGSASTRSQAMGALGRLKVPLLGIMALVALCALSAPLGVPLVFGSSYAKAGVLTSILLLQYVPLLTYSLVNIPLPFICGRRTVVLQAIVLLGVEAAWLAVWRNSDLGVVALAPCAGQVAAAAFTWFRLARVEHADSLAVSGAST